MYNEKMDSGKLWRCLIILSVVGIGFASYLFYEYLSAQSFGICAMGPAFNCDAITKGSLSKVMGIPVPLVGLMGYIVILVSAVLKNKKLALFMGTFGMLFCLRISFLELFFVKIICPVCLLCQLDMVAIFALSLYLIV